MNENENTAKPNVGPPMAGTGTGQPEGDPEEDVQGSPAPTSTLSRAGSSGATAEKTTSESPSTRPTINTGPTVAGSRMREKTGEQ